MINIAVLGYGVVGSGVVEVIRKNCKSIAAKVGNDIRVKKILDVRDFPDSPDSLLLTKNSDDVFNDDSISIVVETIGGTRIAHEFTKRALSSGKSVVTSNKELVATHGPELLKLAKDNNVSYLFEASVGGGIPIIRPLNQCLAANEIHGITGILNGTTNYILTQMKKEGRNFQDALKDAQKNGYAEADPTADIEGYDTCRKIAILSSIAYNTFVDYNNIHTEGIANITLTDMEYAQSMNSSIKLIAMSKKIDDKVFARVSPAIIDNNHPLFGVEDVFNAIVVKGDAIGDAMFYGRGAGKLPTASAVVADIIDIIKHNIYTIRNNWEREEIDNSYKIDDAETKLFIRVESKNTDETKKLIADIFGCVKFYCLDKEELKDEVAFTTPKNTEKCLSEKIVKLESNDIVKRVVNVIRIEED